MTAISLRQLVDLLHHPVLIKCFRMSAFRLIVIFSAIRYIRISHHTYCLFTNQQCQQLKVSFRNMLNQIGFEQHYAFIIVIGLGGFERIFVQGDSSLDISPSGAYSSVNHSITPVPFLKTVLALLDKYNCKSFDVVYVGLRLEDVQNFKKIHCPKLQVSFKPAMELKNNAQGMAEFLEHSTKSQHSNSEFSTVIIFYPQSSAQVQQFIVQVSKFYLEHPEKASVFYIFAIWRPDFVQAPQAIEAYLKPWASKVPLDSHLFFLRLVPGARQLMEVAVIWELYTIKQSVIVFQEVKGNEFLRRTARRMNFRGVTLLCLAQLDPVLRILTVFEIVNGSKVIRGGQAIDLLRTMGRIMNFTAKFVEGDGWITIENGQVFGMGQQLVQGQGDIIISFSEILEQRQTFLTSSQPINSFNVYAFFRKPDRSEYQDVLLEAFSFRLWCLVLASWVAVIWSMSLCKYVKLRFESPLSDMDMEVTDNSVWWAIAAACQTGWHCTPTSPSLQVVCIVALASGLLYYTAYSAAIVSIFSVDINRFRTVDDLDKHGFTLYGNVFSENGLWHVETRAKNAGLTLESRLVNASVAMEKLKCKKFAYVTSRHLLVSSLAYRNISSAEEVCETLTRTTFGISKQHVGLFYRKFDAIKKFIGVYIARYREVGLIYRLQAHYLSAISPECDPKGKENKSLHFKDIQRAFIILGWGFCICSLLLSAEILSHVLRNKDTVVALKYILSND